MSETDRRSRRLYLTKRAVALRDELYQKSMAVLEQALKGVPAEDVQLFKAVLIGFVDNLKHDQFAYESEDDLD